jgi:hypothetical protein
MSRRRTTALLRPFVEVLEGRWVPTTLTPTTLLDGGLGSGSLRDAVLQFNADTGTDDDIIQLEAGTYALTIQNIGGRHESAGLAGDLNLTQTSHRWIIQGAGSLTILDASQLQDRVFQIVNPGTQVVFQDLVIQGGLAQDNGADGAQAGTTDALGGAMFNNGGNVTLDDVVVQNNVARGADAASLGAPGHNASGGGIYSTGGALTLAGATVANNQAIGGNGGNGGSGFVRAGDGGWGSGGGLYATGGSVDISSSMIASNRATGGQGGNGYATYTLSGRTTYVGGGTGGSATGVGLYVNGGSLTIGTTTIASNHGINAFAGRGGYISTASQGGGLYNGGTLMVSNSTLSGNSATAVFGYVGGGGSIYNAGTLTVSNSTLSGNSATNSYAIGCCDYGGGGIDNVGTLTVSNSTLSGNSAETYGGGIYNHGTLTVSNSTLSGNSAIEGGGIVNVMGGALTVSNSTLSGNFATSRSVEAIGGGIYNDGTLTLSNSTLSANSAGNAYGGGIYNHGTLTVSNSTLSGNTAYYGGGIYTFSTNLVVTLTTVTLTANRATDSGGGLFVYAGSPVLHNTLIAGNFRGATGTTRDDVSGALDPSGDYNLIGDGSGMTGLSNGVNGNLVGSAENPIDPLLGPLADNGGPTLTHALLSGSLAIDAGNNAYATDWDQRGPGYPRIVNGTIDIGAFEVQAPAASYPTRQPLPDPVPVQVLGMVGGPLVGQPPEVSAAPLPLPDPASLPTDGGNSAPGAFLPAAAGTGGAVGPGGPFDADDLDPLAQERLGGP